MATLKVKIVEYQVGVDVLGFPIYVQHSIYEGSGTSKINENPKCWLSVIYKEIKQH
jgi:hypothetical protein